MSPTPPGRQEENRGGKGIVTKAGECATLLAQACSISGGVMSMQAKNSEVSSRVHVS